eukprot:2172397-Pyramimonas_sp.AAC.2
MPLAKTRAIRMVSHWGISLKDSLFVEHRQMGENAWLWQHCNAPNDPMEAPLSAHPPIPPYSLPFPTVPSLTPLDAFPSPRLCLPEPFDIALLAE